MTDDQHARASGSDGGSFPPLVDEVIVLVGPTASGKSSVAVRLAEAIGGEIISLDSIAIYRGMDIGTAKPSAADRQRVPHHLLDIVEPSEEFSVACYLKAAHQKIREIKSRGRKAIFVGGTPMFLKGVLRGFDAGPPADWEFRRAVEQDLERHGVEALRARLRQVDPLAAHRIGLNDSRRMIRALEVARYTGTPISHRQVQFDHARAPESCHVFSLHWPRTRLYERINARVDRMFADGLVDEVRRLLEQHGELSRTAGQAVGYRELIDYFKGHKDLPSTINEVATHTRQLAKRQETWFRSFSEIRPIEIQEPFSAATTAEIIRQLVS